MKKLLLIAAMAAVALGASAGYNLEKVWELNTSSILTTADCRQGFGMDGKFYINDKGTQTVYELNEAGLTGKTFPGGKNCGLAFDEAGNFVISNAAFPDPWTEEATIKVVNPSTGEVKEYLVPEDCRPAGRSDLIGFAKGNMMEDGVLYFTGATTDGICILTISGGEVDEDNCYRATCDGLNNTSSTVIYFFKDINNQETLIYDYRSGYPSKLTADADNFIRTGFSLPNLNDVSKKGHANGVFPFIWDGKEFFIYSLMPDYREGFAVAEANASAPIAAVEATLQANPNAFQANWLNAEVDANGVTIYQYVPGYRIAVYRLTKTPDYTVASNILGNWTIDPANNMTLGEDGKYTLTLENVEIPANYLIEYKVTSNGTWWPAGDNATYQITNAGYYTLVFTFDLETGNVSLVATKTGDIHYTGDVYIMGEVNDNGWQTNVGLQMTRDEENNIYTATITTEGKNIDPNDGIGYNYFSFTKMLSEYENDWNTIAPYRFGAVTEGGDFLVTNDQLNKELSLEMNGDPHAFKIPAGQWNLTLSVDNMTLIIEKVVPAGMRGDVNNDQKVDITDATTLINYLLYGDATGINMTNANCDWQNDVDISDATTLINFLLYGTW